MRTQPTLAAALVGLAVVVGCGQFGFDESVDSGSDGPLPDAAPGSDSGRDTPAMDDAGVLPDAPGDTSQDVRADRLDTGVDAPVGVDASVDAGDDAPMDAGTDAPDAGPPPCPASGLRAWYRLDEVAGPVLDSSGCGLHGVALGVIRGERGVHGAAARWNNSGSIRVATFEMIEAEWPDYTFEAWISYNDSPLATIAAASDGMGGDPFNFSIYTGDEVSVSLPGAACTGMTAYVDRSGVTVPRSAWTHVAASVNPRSGMIRYFVDGRQTGTGMATPLFCASVDGLYLGTLGPSTGWALNGLLDDIKIWNVQRTEDDVCRDAGGVVRGAGCDLTGVRP